jgi:hypothetical protein
MENNVIKFHSSQALQAIVTDTGMLSDHDKAILEKAHNKEWKNPKFKVRWFVGESQYTPYGKMKQFLLELKSRENTVEMIEYEIAKFEVQEKIHLRNAENTDDELEAEMQRIEAAKVRKDINRSINRVADFYRERNDLIDCLNEFLASSESKTPDGRSLMDILDTSEEEEYEKQYWTVRLARQAAMDMCSYGRIGAGNLEAIMMLDKDHQVEVIGLANHLNLSYDTRHQLIRNQIAQQLGITPPKDVLIGGGLEADLINTMIQADRPGVIDELTNTPQQNTNEDLNNVYNL